MEVLSLGHSLEIIKDLGDAEHGRRSSTTSTGSRARTRSVTSGWRPSPTSTSRAPTLTGRIRSTTSRSCTTASSRTTSSGSTGSSGAGHRFQSECDSEIIAVYLAEKMSDGYSLEDAMRESLEELDGVFTYIVRHRRRARRGEGRDGCEAARPLRGRRHRRAGLGGDRDPRHRRPRDRDVRSLRGRGDGVDSASRRRMITYDARGLVEPDDTVPRIAEIDGDRAVFDAKSLTTRQINLELRWLLYEEGVKDVTVLNPGAKHSLGVGILTRCRITFDGSLGYFGCGLIDGPEIHINGRVGWSSCENMMSGVVVDRVQRRLADRGGDPRRRPRSSRAWSERARGSTRRAARSSSLGRRRLDDRLHDAARPPDLLRQRRPGPRRLDVRRHDLRRRQGQVARHRLCPGRVDRCRHGVDRAQVPHPRARRARPSSRSSSAARSSTTTTTSSRPSESWCSDGRRDRGEQAQRPRDSRRSSRRRSSTTST